MHQELTSNESQALNAAHVALTQVVARFEEAAYALPGPVPLQLRADYWAALRKAFGLALPPYCGPNTVVPTTPRYRAYLAGLREIAVESMAAFPREVDEDMATHVADWETVQGWLETGA